MIILKIIGIIYAIIAIVVFISLFPSRIDFRTALGELINNFLIAICWPIILILIILSFCMDARHEEEDFSS